jgi:hypothetical protein
MHRSRSPVGGASSSARSTRATRAARAASNPARSRRGRGRQNEVKNDGAPAKKWAKVLRPPGENIRFKVEMWVPVTDLTPEERATYDAEVAARMELQLKQEQAKKQAEIAAAEAAAAIEETIAEPSKLQDDDDDDDDDDDEEKQQDQEANTETQKEENKQLQIEADATGGQEVSTNNDEVSSKTPQHEVSSPDAGEIKEESTMKESARAEETTVGPSEDVYVDEAKHVVEEVEGSGGDAVITDAAVEEDTEPANAPILDSSQKAEDEKDTSNSKEEDQEGDPQSQEEVPIAKTTTQEDDDIDDEEEEAKSSSDAPQVNENEQDHEEQEPSEEPAAKKARIE